MNCKRKGDIGQDVSGLNGQQLSHCVTAVYLKGKFYRMTIRPTLLYRSKCSTSGKDNITMSVARMDMLRWCMGISLKKGFEMRLFGVRLELQQLKTN